MKSEAAFRHVVIQSSRILPMYSFVMTQGQYTTRRERTLRSLTYFSKNPTDSWEKVITFPCLPAREAGKYGASYIATLKQL